MIKNKKKFLLKIVGDDEVEKTVSLRSASQNIDLQFLKLLFPEKNICGLHAIYENKSEIFIPAQDNFLSPPGAWDMEKQYRILVNQDKGFTKKNPQTATKNIEEHKSLKGQLLKLHYDYPSNMTESVVLISKLADRVENERNLLSSVFVRYLIEKFGEKCLLKYGEKSAIDCPDATKIREVYKKFYEDKTNQDSATVKNVLGVSFGREKFIKVCMDLYHKTSKSIHTAGALLNNMLDENYIRDLVTYMKYESNDERKVIEAIQKIIN